MTYANKKTFVVIGFVVMVTMQKRKLLIRIADSAVFVYKVYLCKKIEKNSFLLYHVKIEALPCFVVQKKLRIYCQTCTQKTEYKYPVIIPFLSQ